MAKHHIITINAAVIVGSLMLGTGQSFAQSPPSLADIYGQANQRTFEAEQSQLQEQRRRQNESAADPLTVPNYTGEAYGRYYSGGREVPAYQQNLPGLAPGVILPVPGVGR